VIRALAPTSNQSPVTRQSLPAVTCELLPLDDDPVHALA
jgi:hypothetical protein